jgi:hypothetical protein
VYVAYGLYTVVFDANSSKIAMVFANSRRLMMTRLNCQNLGQLAVNLGSGQCRDGHIQ